MSEAGQSVPYFHAMAVFACQPNRFYRVYVRPDELLFIWAGAGGEGMAGAAAASRMIAPGAELIGGAMQAMLDPSRKNARRAEVLDHTPLDQLIGDHKKNLRAPIDGFTEVRIRQRSDRHARLTSDHHHQAILIVRHRTLGKYALGIASVPDVRLAMEELPRVLGGVYSTEIEPPERYQPCGCVFCK